MTEPTAFDGRSDFGPFIANGVPPGGLFTGAEGIKTPRQEAIYGGFAGLAYDPCHTRRATRSSTRASPLWTRSPTGRPTGPGRWCRQDAGHRVRRQGAQRSKRGKDFKYKVPYPVH